MFETVTATCKRCGFGPLQAADGNPDARLLRHAREGLCASCAITQVIKATPMVLGIERNGVEILRDPRVQAQFARLLDVGRADASPDEIDWERVITNWELPDPTRRGRRR
jgi:hypothetical protein